MNIEDQSVTSKNQYTNQSPRIIAHLENYYKVYGPLFIFFLVIFFLLKRRTTVKNPTKARVSHSTTDNNTEQTLETLEEEKLQNNPRTNVLSSHEIYTPGSNTNFSELEINRENETSVKSQNLRDKASQNSGKIKEEAPFQDSKKTEEIIKTDWSEIQKILRTILQDVQKCFNFSRVNEGNLTLSKDRIFPFQPIEPRKYQLIRDLTDFSDSMDFSRSKFGSKFRSTPGWPTKIIGNWKIEISNIDVELSRRRTNGQKTIVTLRNCGLWSISQEKNSLFVDNGILHHSITLSGESVTLYGDKISFTDKSENWESTYDEINNDNDIIKTHKNQLLSFFTILESVLQIDLQDLINALKEN